MRRILGLCFLLLFPIATACGGGDGDDNGAQTGTGTTGGTPTDGTGGAAPAEGAPLAPDNLTAIAGNGLVILTWNASATATSYRILGATQAGGPFVVLATVRGTSYLQRNLVNGTTYYYVVVPINAAGAGGNSVTVSATPSAGAVIPAPQAPEGLQALSGDGQVQLSWDVSAGATSYLVFSSQTSGGPYTLLDETDTTFFTHTGLTNDTTYYYVVQASNLTGTSDNSSQVTGTPIATAPPPVTEPAPPETPVTTTTF